MVLQAFTLTGTGAALAISDAALGIPKQCKWFQLLLTAAGLDDSPPSAGVLNLGGPDVDVNTGYPIGVGGANFQPPIATGFDFYDLEGTYIFLGTGDEAVLLCGV